MILTHPQRHSLKRSYQSALTAHETQKDHVPSLPPPTYHQFRANVRPTGAEWQTIHDPLPSIMVPFANMWLGIDPDGTRTVARFEEWTRTRT